MDNFKKEVLEVPLKFKDDIYSLKMHDKKIKNNNKDESDSDEYDMDPEEEIMAKVSCNATNID